MADLENGSAANFKEVAALHAPYPSTVPDVIQPGTPQILQLTCRPVY